MNRRRHKRRRRNPAFSHTGQKVSEADMADAPWSIPIKPPTGVELDGVISILSHFIHDVVAKILMNKIQRQERALKKIATSKCKSCATIANKALTDTHEDAGYSQATKTEDDNKKVV